jgi:hypothetical protein
MTLYKTVAAVMADTYAQSLEASEVHNYIGRKSISMVICVAEERVRLARSQAVRKRRRARGLVEGSL